LLNRALTSLANCPTNVESVDCHQENFMSKKLKLVHPGERLREEVWSAR